MDLLFKRYASPFSLIEILLSTGRFSDFVSELIDIENEEEQWNFYIHRVFDQSWEEFRNSITSRSNVQISSESLETTLQSSKSLLNNFIPS